MLKGIKESKGAQAAMKAAGGKVEAPVEAEKPVKAKKEKAPPKTEGAAPQA